MPYRTNQAAQQHCDFRYLVLQLLEMRRLTQKHDSRYFDMRIELACRSKRDVQEPHKLFVPVSCRSLCDIAGYRYGSAAHLRYETEAFLSWVLGRNSIDIFRKLDGETPDFEIFVRFH